MNASDPMSTVEIAELRNKNNQRAEPIHQLPFHKRPDHAAKAKEQNRS